VIVRAGPYVFSELHVNPDRTLVDLSIDGRGGVGDDETPEGHWWFVAANDADEIVALQLVDPVETLRRDGAVNVTLPSGEKVAVEGIEEALRQPA